MSIPSSVARAPRGARPFLRTVVCALTVTALLPLGLGGHAAVGATGNLVVSEVVTGGASANDELVELYNPSTTALPLEGLELVYVSASGATVTRRVGWELGAPTVAPGNHLLVANELGAFASIADALYAGGMAATGGSVALRIQGATTALDAVGWGAAASTWLEGSPAPAPPAGSSIERLPGGDAGSTMDTGNNAADFAVRALPDPQNSASPAVPETTPPSPTATPTLTPTPTPTGPPDGTPAPSATPTPAASSSPTGSPGPAPMAIGIARGMPDGSPVTIEATAHTGSEFADGGGYLADATGGIAVLLDAGSFARGEHVLVSGTVDDRFAQRTLRAATVAARSGPAAPEPMVRSTGSVNEDVEGRLVRVEAMIEGGSTALSGGLAFDVDDGTGVARVVVGTTTGIDTSGWIDGRRVIVVGVVGQRDSSGTGSSGYRVQPRDPADVAVLPAPSPSMTQSPAPQQPSASPSTPDPGEVVTVAEARSAPSNAQLTVRGVITLASGTVDAESAVLQDATGAILLRVGDEAGPLLNGELVEVDGVRSTKSGMESLRISASPRRLGTAPDPAARALRTGEAAEGIEAHVVLVRGALVADARRASSGTVTFEIDDGSGPLRVVLGAALQARDEHLTSGSWVEALGVLGQETTGSQPALGYRVWPRGEAEVRVLAAATEATDEATRPAGGMVNGNDVIATGGGAASADSLEAIYSGSLADLRVGATLVTGAWHELRVAGLLWDGERVVGIDASSGPELARAVGPRIPPISLELSHMGGVGTHTRLGSAVVTLGAAATDVIVGAGPTAAPLARIPAAGSPAAWVSLVGRLSVTGGGATLSVDGGSVSIEQACERAQTPRAGAVSVRGIALSGPSRIVVPCGGIGPAPALQLKIASMVTGDRPRTDSVLATAAKADPAGQARRGLAVGLLAVGVVVLVLAAVARRRFDPDGGEQVRAGPLPTGEDPADGPQLSLVRLPPERGP